MPVLMFEQRFADLVASGQKRQTIRVPRRVRPIAVGDSLSLRRWSDKPYRSPQVVLKLAKCKSVHRVMIWRDAISIDGTIPPTRELNQMARDDGFHDWGDMQTWFEAAHGLPFDGVLIRWEDMP